MAEAELAAVKAAAAAIQDTAVLPVAMEVAVATVEETGGRRIYQYYTTR